MQRISSNKDFLARLRDAEHRDQQNLQKQRHGPAGEDTFKAISEAERVSRLEQREAEAAARAKLSRPLTQQELAAAATLFWEFDADANAVIDKEEWTQLLQQVAEQTGARISHRMPAPSLPLAVRAVCNGPPFAPARCQNAL
jgi:hypothetical protein